MIFLKKTFKYLKKSFMPLVVAAIIPSLILGFFSSPLTSITFLPTYFSTKSVSFYSVLNMLVDINLFIHAYWSLLILISLVFGFSYALGIIEKHFKTGKLGISNPIRAVNNTMLPVIKILPILLVIFIISVFMQSGLVFLLRFIISGTSKSPKVFECVWVGILSLIIYTFVIMASVVTAVWAVTMQIYGYSFSDAFVESMRTLSKKWFQLVMGLIVPVTLLSIPQIVINILKIDSFIINFSISTATYLILIVYYLAYIFVSVYELNNLERRDIKSYPSIKY